MRKSINIVTLIKIAAVMIVAVIAYNCGYFQSQMDDSRLANKYTVNVEKTPSPEELAEEQERLEALKEFQIDINTASAEELEKLPGIGAVLAERIVEYRKLNGKFEYRFNIMDVSGIGTGVYNKIKDSIYAG